MAMAQPHMGEEIPSSYILLEEQVRFLRKKKMVLDIGEQFNLLIPFHNYSRKNVRKQEASTLLIYCFFLCQVRIAAQTTLPPIIPMDRFEEMASRCGIADRGGMMCFPFSFILHVPFVVRVCFLLALAFFLFLYTHAFEVSINVCHFFDT